MFGGPTSSSYEIHRTFEIPNASNIILRELVGQYRSVRATCSLRVLKRQVVTICLTCVLEFQPQQFGFFEIDAVCETAHIDYVNQSQGRFICRCNAVASSLSLPPNCKLFLCLQTLHFSGADIILV